MSKLLSKILKQVKEKGVKRIPRWRFILDHAATWFILIVAIIVSSLSVAMIIHQCYVIEWDVIGRMPRGGMAVYFKVVPYLWIAISAVLFYFVYLEFKKTKTGHRYGAEIIIGSTVGISILFGVIFFFSRGAGHLQEKFDDKIPYYKNLHMNSQSMWENPDEGFLGGNIERIEEGTYYVRDFLGNVWEVEVNDETVIKHLVKDEGRIKILGEKLEAMKFKAKEIRPWQKPMPFR